MAHTVAKNPSTPHSRILLPTAIAGKVCRGPEFVHKAYTAVSVHWGLLFVGVLKIRALLFEIHNRTPDFWKLTDELLSTFLVSPKDMDPV